MINEDGKKLPTNLHLNWLNIFYTIITLSFFYVENENILLLRNGWVKTLA